MATSTNLGFQKLTFDFKSPLKGSDFNKLLYGITKPGVYKGLNLSKVGNTTISISSGIALLHTSFQGSTSSSTLVNFQTNINVYDVTRTNSSENEIVYLKFDYLETTDNWVEVLHTNSGNLSSLSANAVILGEVIYNESNVITSFNYDVRTYGLLNSDTSKVILNDSNIIGNANNPSKQIKLSASNSASGTTRNISFPDYDYQVNTLNDWVTNRKYYVNEIITYNKIIYKCITTHTSNVFNSDALIYWQRLVEKYEKESFNVTGSPSNNFDIPISSNTSLLLITGQYVDGTINTIYPSSGNFDDGKVLEIQNETTSYLYLNIKNIVKPVDYAFTPYVQSNNLNFVVPGKPYSNNARGIYGSLGNLSTVNPLNEIKPFERLKFQFQLSQLSWVDLGKNEIIPNYIQFFVDTQTDSSYTSSTTNFVIQIRNPFAIKNINFKLGAVSSSSNSLDYPFYPSIFEYGDYLENNRLEQLSPFYFYAQLNKSALETFRSSNRYIHFFIIL